MQPPPTETEIVYVPKKSELKLIQRLNQKVLEAVDMIAEINELPEDAIFTSQFVYVRPKPASPADGAPPKTGPAAA